jgi:hypothetical protein
VVVLVAIDTSTAHQIGKAWFEPAVLQITDGSPGDHRARRCRISPFEQQPIQAVSVRSFFFR